MSSRRKLSSNLFLLKEMVLRDVRARYAGSGLGLLWAFAMPLLWMVIYTWVFSSILRVPTPTGFATFPEFLMAGLLPWLAIHEAISRCATVLADNAAMVKKTVFPLESLVLSVVLAAAVNQVIAFLIFALYVAILGHLAPAYLGLALLALALQILMTFGLGCLVATVTTFARDAAHGVGIALTVLFYATPIVYPASLVPARFAPFVAANPVAHLAEWYRMAFTLHRLPEPASVLFVGVFAVAAAALGWTLFLRAKPHFADLI
jgi:ABC-type polysaccharide/polyol phosphate export permease